MSPALVQRLGVVPLDDAARDGRNQLVFTSGRFAIVRWRDEQWRFPSGQPWPAKPTHYKPRKD